MSFVAGFALRNRVVFDFRRRETIAQQKDNCLLCSFVYHN